jgi:hypothetical protein
MLCLMHHSPIFNYSSHIVCCVLKFVTMSLTYLKLEVCCDFLTVYDGPSDSYPLLTKLTGEILPTPFTVQSTQQNVFLKFTTDYSVQNPGFSLLYV